MFFSSPSFAPPFYFHPVSVLLSLFPDFMSFIFFLVSFFFSSYSSSSFSIFSFLLLLLVLFCILFFFLCLIFYFPPSSLFSFSIIFLLLFLLHPLFSPYPFFSSSLITSYFSSAPTFSLFPLLFLFFVSSLTHIHIHVLFQCSIITI